MKSDRVLRIQLPEWEASVLISCMTSLPTPTPFKRTQIYIWIFHKQERVPSRFAQIEEKCSFDSDPENTSLNGCTKRHSISKRSLTKPIWSHGCRQRTNEADEVTGGIDEIGQWYRPSEHFLINIPFSSNMMLKHPEH